MRILFKFVLCLIVSFQILLGFYFPRCAYAISGSSIKKCCCGSKSERNKPCDHQNQSNMGCNCKVEAQKEDTFIEQKSIKLPEFKFLVTFVQVFSLFKNQAKILPTNSLANTILDQSFSSHFFNSFLCIWRI